MADLNNPKNAAAPEILAALKTLGAEIKAARASIGVLEKQVTGLGLAGQGGGVASKVGAAGEARTAAEYRELASLAEKRRGALQQEAALTKEIGDSTARNTSQEVRQGEAIARNLALQRELAAVTEQAARMPAGMRAGYIANQAASASRLQPGLAPMEGGLAASQIRAAQSSAVTADAPARLAESRAGFTNLAVAESQYLDKTRSASAMSGEFLGRLASGQATLGEFGRNLAQTSGKFAGWTAAAAGVGGLIAATGALYHGARDSSSGVNQLSRSIDNVNPGKAQQGFRQLSQEMNVSIKEASDAQFQFARTFNSQDASLQAARVGLRAYRLDNVSVADSVRAFTAVHNQFGVQADQLLPLFDKLDEGQRKFNARVSESLPALTRSAAGVKNAGGDLNDLLKIIVYGVRVTGQSGNVLGNALSRSATNFVPKVKNANELRALGFDPTQAYTSLITEAIQRATSMTGEQRRQLANALGGPQLGSRVFAPLLGGRPGQFDTVSKGLDNAKGSSAKEMADLLSQVNEQVTAIGHGLQRIGSSLAESGAFAGLGVALRVLNLSLTVVGKLLDLFNGLPKSIRPWIAGLIEARGLMLILQRTRLGAGLADKTGLGFLGPSPQRRAAQQEIGALGRQAAVFEGSAAQAGSAAVAARAEKNFALDNQIAAARAGEQAKALAYQEQATAAEEREVTQLRAAEQLSAEAAAMRQRIAALQKDENAASAELVAAQTEGAGIRTAGLAALSAAGAAGAGSGLAQDVALARGLSGGRGLSAAERAAVAEKSAVTAGGATGGRALSAAEQAAVAEAGASTSLVEKAGAGIAGGASSVLGVGKRWGSGLKRFGSGMGLFSKGLLTFIVAQAFFDDLKQHTAAIEQYETNLNAQSSTLDQLRAQREKATKPQDIGIAGHVIDIGFGTNVQGSVDDAAAARKRMDDTILKDRQLTAQGTKRGDYKQVGYSYEELLKEQQNLAKEFQDGHISRSKYKERSDAIGRSLASALEVLTGDTRGLAGAEKGQQQAFNAGFAKLGSAQGGDPFSQFRHQSLQQNVDFLDLVNSRTKVRGTSAVDFTSIARGIGYISRDYGATKDKKQLASIDQAFQSLDTYISTQADEFKTILDGIKQSTGDKIPASAITPGLVSAELGTQARRSDSAYKTYIATLRSQQDGLHKRMGELSTGLHQDQRDLANAEKKLHDEGGLTATGGVPSVFGPIGGAINPAIRAPNQKVADTALEKRVADLKKQITDDRKKLGISADALKKGDAKIQAAIAQAQEDQFSLDSQAIDLRSQYAQATAKDPSDAIAEKIKADGQQVELAMKYHGPDRWAKIMQALITKQNDIASQAQQHLQDISLQGDLAVSQIRGNTPQADEARLRKQLEFAQRALTAARAEAPNPQRTQDIINAEIKVNDLQNQLDNQVQQDAQAVDQQVQAYIQSQVAVAVARAGNNPLAAANAQLSGDQQILGTINRKDFKTQREYLTAVNNQRAQIIRDQTARQQAIVQQDQSLANLQASQVAIAVAQAGDNPVKVDKLNLHADLAAMHNLKRSDFNSTADYQTARNNALAKTITDRRQIVTDTANTDLQNAQFEHEIGKLTDDQYITQLKKILQLKGLSKQMRQNLLLEIYRTEHANDSALSLNLGDIKLPSSYQIVRGLRQKLNGAGSKPISTNSTGALFKQENHNTFTFHIAGNGPKAQKELTQALGQALDSAIGGSALANLRAAGAI